MTNLRPPLHPACAVYPMMSEEDLLALGLDIEKFGQRDPVVLLLGQLLDGKNRWEACSLNGIDALTREFGSDPNDGDDPVRFVFSKNNLRRHLSYNERCMVADAISALSMPHRPEKTNLNKIVITQEEAAKRHGVSQSGVSAARTIRLAHKNKEVPDQVVEDVKKGKKSIQKIANEIRAKSRAENPDKPKRGPKKKTPTPVVTSLEEVRAKREARARKIEEALAQGQRLEWDNKPVVMFGVQLWPVADEDRLKLGHYDYDQLFFGIEQFEAWRTLLPPTDDYVSRSARLHERVKPLRLFADRRIPEPGKTEMNRFIAVYHLLCDLYQKDPTGECKPPFDLVMRRG